VDKDRMPDVLETFRRRDFDQHARGPIGARPDDAGVSRDVARLNAVADDRTISRAAKRWKAAERDRRGQTCRVGQEPAPREHCAGPRVDGHWASAVESQTRGPSPP